MTPSSYPTEREQNPEKYGKPQRIPERTGPLYYTIPAEVYEDENLTGEEILFYALLVGLAHSSGFCYAKDKYLADRRKVSITTIQRWTRSLEKKGYIRVETDRNGMYWDRKIFISHSKVSKNYNEYSSVSIPNTHPRPYGIHTDDHCLSIKEESNKEREETLSCAAPPRHKKKFCFSHDAMELAKLLFSKILEYHPTHKKPNLEAWAHDIQLAHRTDGRSLQQLRMVIEWSQGDSFWRGNVQSGAKLRKQFDQLWIKMKSAGARTDTPSQNAHSFSMEIIKKNETLRKMLDLGKIAVFGDKVVVYGGQSQREFMFKEPNFRERFEEYAKKIIEIGVRL